MMSNLRAALCVTAWLLLTGCGQRDDSRRTQPPAVAGNEATPGPQTTPAPLESAPASSSRVDASPPSETPAETAESPIQSSEFPPAQEAPNPAETPPPQNDQPELDATPPAESPPDPVATPASPVVDPGGPIGVEATKAGLTRVGPEKCKVCHKVQFGSWSASAHAKRTPPLDCESCHGPGSEYKVLSVMKDPEKARAAGLVIPNREFCATCHVSGWSDDMLIHAHAHKPAAGTN